MIRTFDKYRLFEADQNTDKVKKYNSRWFTHCVAANKRKSFNRKNHHVESEKSQKDCDI